MTPRQSESLCKHLASLSEPGQINKLCPPLRRPAETVPLEVPEMRNRVLLVHVLFFVNDALRMPIAEHAPVDFPIINQLLRTPRMLTEEVLGVVPVAVVCDGAGPFDGLAT